MFQRYFSRIVCLSLASRSDRREQFDAQAQNIGMEFEYYIATPKTAFQNTPIRPLRGSGHNVATYAHNFDLRNMLQECLDKDLESMLFFEDDCILEPSALETFEHVYHTELPPIWDLFYLGAWHRVPPVQVSESLCKVTKAHLSHAVAIHKRVMPLLLQHCQKNEQLFDQILAEKIHPLGHSYCLLPNVAKQADGYSNIWEMDVEQAKRQSSNKLN